MEKMKNTASNIYAASISIKLEYNRLFAGYIETYTLKFDLLNSC